MLGLGCQGITKIPDTKFYAEIPFVDCPEGVSISVLTRKRTWYSCEEWKKRRPYMVMVDPEGKAQIFQQWYEACRWAGKNCNVQLNSVMNTVQKLDKLTETVLKK